MSFLAASAAPRPAQSLTGCALLGLIATGLLLAAAWRLARPLPDEVNELFISSLYFVPVGSGFLAALLAAGSRQPLAWRPLVGVIFSLAYAVAKILVILCAVPAVVLFFFLGPFTLLLLPVVFLLAFPLVLAGAGLGAATVWAGYRAKRLLAAS